MLYRLFSVVSGSPRVLTSCCAPTVLERLSTASISTTSSWQGRKKWFKSKDGEPVFRGKRVVRQSSTVVYPGTNVAIGKNHSLFGRNHIIYSLVDGHVKYSNMLIKQQHGRKLKKIKYINIIEKPNENVLVLKGLRAEYQSQNMIENSKK